MSFTAQPVNAKTCKSALSAAPHPTTPRGKLRPWPRGVRSENRNSLDKTKRNETKRSQFALITLIQSRSSVVRAFAHGAMGRWIDASWWTH